jgi:isoquinoline 1-oxidoreductase subunit beta
LLRPYAQSEIIFGITAALHGKITLKNGRVEQTNFDTYQMSCASTRRPPSRSTSSRAPSRRAEWAKPERRPCRGRQRGLRGNPASALRKLPLDAAALKQPA